MKIWITGIAGFLGGHLFDALAGEFYAPDGGRDNEVSGNDNHLCSTRPDSYGISADCRDYDKMFSLLSEFKPDVLIHCAATAQKGSAPKAGRAHRGHSDRERRIDEDQRGAH